ncbi:hypothetical protein GCM10010429_38890 [Micromonospora olivasterospora]|uniref:Glutathione S-transferase n=1 Tax=Micromonospora olivasterospora TaxID=1880 RepID=A0A562IE53_MICOL|nr:hypothetical protein JD77_03895 [Micromonospora olivasterospora]
MARAQFSAETSTGGEFVRQPNRFTGRVTADSDSPPGAGPDARGRWPLEAGRYRLIWCPACPWSHRAVIVRGHFKCNRNKLTELPVLWAYARDLFQTPGFGDTVDFDAIKRHYYRTHTAINPTGVVPLGPDLSGWDTPHGRG